MSRALGQQALAEHTESRLRFLESTTVEQVFAKESQRGHRIAVLRTVSTLAPFYELPLNEDGLGELGRRRRWSPRSGRPAPRPPGGCDFPALLANWGAGPYLLTGISAKRL